MDDERHASARDGYALLTRLYAEQLAAGGTDYLAEHARPDAVRHHVNVFEWYANGLRPDMTVLDWGCNHGPDSCLLRRRFGDALELRACDFGPKEAFRVFRDYAARRTRGCPTRSPSRSRTTPSTRSSARGCWSTRRWTERRSRRSTAS